MGDERVVDHEPEATAAADRVASGGSPQAAANSCGLIPSAMFIQAAVFIAATLPVNSISPGTPRASSNSADISSVTAGGVWHIASAYAKTLRSTGVNTSLSRQRGTSRALASSSPRLRVMK